jgi:hypothetical protein
MTQELADAEEARESVFEFRTELRRRAALVPEEGPPLRVYLEHEGRAVPRRLAWTAVDGAHSAIAFRSGTNEFVGVHRGADGTVVELHGSLAGRRAYPLLPPGVESGDVLAFDTHEERLEDGADGTPDGVWRTSGRTRLLLDDGRGCPLRDLQWEDTRGITAAVSFEPDRSGFIGYLARPGRQPVRFRGFAVPGRQVPEGEDLLKDLEDFGRQALGVVTDVVGRLAGWIGGSGGSGGDAGGGPRPA